MSTGQDWRSIQEEEDLQHPRNRFSRGMVLTASSIILLITVLIFWPILQYKVSPVSAEDSSKPTQISTEFPYPSPTLISTHTPTPKLTATISPTGTSTPSTSHLALPQEDNSSAFNEGTIIISLNEAGNYHLFAFQSFDYPYTRLTSGPWDDITPALSPDGRWLAFSSNRSGAWDLYLLDLHNGDITRLTDNPHFEASPSWSPDGNLLAYERYNDNSEIMIRSVFDDRVRINLSEHPAADYQPSWSPEGRQVAFISNRSGEHEVWLANFDIFDEHRFTNISQSSGIQESHPIWSPDGSSLAWAALQGGNHSLIMWNPDQGSQYIASGDWPVWSPDGSLVISSLRAPNQSLLTAYHVSDSLLALPPLILPGSISGLTWSNQTLSNPLPATISQISAETPAAPWTSPQDEKSAERAQIVPLRNVIAPYPELHDAVDEAFQALQAKVAEESGWDFLSSLDNAYLPLSAPLPPGMEEDWLYTGRAFAFDTQIMNTGWVIVVPEKFGHQTYWRVYIKARFQNGSLGKPLHELPWNFNARYAGDPLLYEQGGYLEEGIPAGYWVDFTAIANSFGWQRLPALPIWQSAFFAARFNEFVLPGEQTWREAMLELYPPEALLTPTPIYPPTLPPTRTPSWPISSSQSP
jgi:TolB protein